MMVRTRRGAIIGASPTQIRSKDIDFELAHIEALIDDTTSYVSSLSHQSRLEELSKINVDVDSRQVGLLQLEGLGFQGQRGVLPHVAFAILEALTAFTRDLSLYGNPTFFVQLIRVVIEGMSGALPPIMPTHQQYLWLQLLQSVLLLWYELYII